MRGARDRTVLRHVACSEAGCWAVGVHVAAMSSSVEGNNCYLEGEASMTEALCLDEHVQVCKDQ